MCLIVHKPAGKPFDVGIIKNASWSNSDGIGLLWIDPESGSIRHQKALPKNRNKAEKIAEFLASQIGADVEAAIHLRMRTHGTIGLSNVHPFVSTSGKSAVMHNGILTDYTPAKGSTESDTAVFAKHSAFPLLEAVSTNDDLFEVSHLLESEIGQGNRILIAREGFGLRIIGNWTEHNGLHYSNSGYLPVARKWYDLPTLRSLERSAEDRKKLAVSYGFAVSDEIDELDPDTLWDLADLSYEQVRSYVRRNPDEVTELIFAHLDDLAPYY